MTKRSNNIVKILAIVAIFVLALSLVLVGCDKLKDAGKSEADEGVKHITVVVGANDNYVTLTVETDENYLAPVLMRLAKEEKITNYTFHGSVYGTFIDTVNNLPGNTPNAYLSVYMTINEVGLVDATGFMPPVTVENKTYYASNVGVDGVPVRNGESYLLTVFIYNA